MSQHILDTFTPEVRAQINSMLNAAWTRGYYVGFDVGCDTLAQSMGLMRTPKVKPPEP